MGSDTQTVTKELTISTLDENQKKKIEDIQKGIVITDSQGIIQYGAGVQAKLADFADSLLNQVKAKDAGHAGTALSELMLTVKKLDVDSLSSESFMSKIPVLGNFMSGAKRFVARYQSIETHIEKITDELEKARMQLLKDITLLDALFDKNSDYIVDLDLYILAGEIKLKDLQENMLPEMKKKAQESTDPLDAQKVQDLGQMINRFEKKIHDLKLSRTISIQAMPQIRLIQNNDQLLVEKIQSSILNTIPLWKNQVVIAISLFRQKKALELQKKVSSTTNDLLTKNSELLKESSLDIARESEKGIVEIETLKKVHENLISTIEETLKIQAEGSVKRKEAEVEMAKMEAELKNKLAAVKESGAPLKLD